MTIQHDIQAGRHAPVFKYAIGEDVVASLDAAEIFDIEASTLIRASTAPDWTIGTVIDHAPSELGWLYVLRFLFGDGVHVAIVAERAIEGIA